MSNPQVPEVSREEQLEELRQALLGNRAFGHARGMLGQSIGSLFDFCLNGAPSRRRVVDTWSKRAAEYCVMLSLLAKFERDNKLFAAKELRRALEKPGYMITGEEVPFEQTSPYTVFMIDPELTFGMMDLARAWTEFNGDDTITKLQDKNFVQGRFPKPMCELIAAIDWKEVSAIEPHKVWPIPLMWYRLTNLFCARLKIPTQEFGHQIADLVSQGHYEEGGGVWANLTGNRRYIPELSCAFGKPCEQSQLLAAFSRDDQARVASWQFHLPTAMGFESWKNTFIIGFHLEAEHARWKKERPQFASRGTSNGYGAIILPNDDVDHVYGTKRQILLRNQGVTRSRY